MPDVTVTGAEYVAAFLARAGCQNAFAVNGGAVAFLLDAVARHPELDLVCVHHEQAAAMAADAVWRVSRRLGVSLATSGPGATNLVTGIACSYFDSIPSLHITGQVNQRESSAVHGAWVRQSGFQETRIVDVVRPIAKRATTVHSTDELREELEIAHRTAFEGRMGPVLIDIPMDVQQALMTLDTGDATAPTAVPTRPGSAPAEAAAALRAALASAERPVVLWGGGVAMAGAEEALSTWLARSEIPFVSSWAGLSAFDHRHPQYVGQIGVYGDRAANFVVQNADAVIVLGSRLDNRQRSGDAQAFARGAAVHVVDVDPEELKKYGGGRYSGLQLDLAALPSVLADVPAPPPAAAWTSYVAEVTRAHGRSGTDRVAAPVGETTRGLSPYAVVQRLAEVLDEDAVIAADTGAAVCWLHQAFSVRRHTLFTAGGHSPMGYALCAAIGAALEAPGRQVVAYTGDGGFQLNLQELETVRRLQLDLAVVVMNNGCYGIIKQFQDVHLGGRHTGSSEGYSAPDLDGVAAAYGVRYARVTEVDALTADLFRGGPVIVDVMVDPDAQITPKMEVGRPINDQSPRLPDHAYEAANRFVPYPREAPAV